MFLGKYYLRQYFSHNPSILLFVSDELDAIFLTDDS